MVICLERGADLHMAQLMPLPLTVSCFSKIQIGSTFLVPAHPGSPGQRAVKRVCVSHSDCLQFSTLNWDSNGGDSLLGFVSVNLLSNELTQILNAHHLNYARLCDIMANTSLRTTRRVIISKWTRIYQMLPVTRQSLYSVISGEGCNQTHVHLMH